LAVAASLRPTLLLARTLTVCSRGASLICKLTEQLAGLVQLNERPSGVVVNE
jgi:hypothetical protein